MWYHNEPVSHLLYMFRIEVLEYDPLAPETFCHLKKKKGYPPVFGTVFLLYHLGICNGDSTLLAPVWYE